VPSLSGDAPARLIYADALKEPPGIISAAVVDTHLSHR
jgi:hypothetical protein